MNDEIGLEELTPWLLIPITLLGGFLRILLLGVKGMGLDETFSLWLASHSVIDMLQWIVTIDHHPPLYYLLLHSWIVLVGDTPYDARLLSALLGAGTIPIIFLIGKRISGLTVGLAAAVLLALSPFHIHYAQETRMYTLLTFNAAVAIYALVRLLTDPCSARPIGSQFQEYVRAWRTPRPVEPDDNKNSDVQNFSYQEEDASLTGQRARIFRTHRPPVRAIETDLAWVAFIVFSAATMLSHNTAVFFPLAVNIFVLGLILFQRRGKSGGRPAFHAPSFRDWFKAQIGIFLLWSPWIPSFIEQASTVDQRFWIPAPTWDAVLQTLRTFLNSSAPMPAGQAAAIWSLYGLALCLGLVHFRKKFSRFLFLVALIAVPFLGELLVSIRRPIFWDRTLIWTTLPLFLVLAAGLAQFRYRFLMIVMAGIFGFVNLFSAGDYYRFFQKDDWSSAAGYVAKFAEKDDLILFNSNFVEIPFNYYFQPYEKMYDIQVVKRGVPLDLFDSGILEPEMTAEDVPRFISSLRGYERVWLVYSRESYTDPTGLIPQTLASQRKLIRTRDFYGGQVQLYGNP